MPHTTMKTVRSMCSTCGCFPVWCPLLFIAIIVAWSYYAYVVELCFYSVKSYVERAFYFIFYHVIFVMFIWSYLQTTLTEKGVVPEEFKLSKADAEKIDSEQSEDNRRRTLEEFAKDLPVVCRTRNGYIRYCAKCHVIKPDRSHHCSICGVCVLKMDHHCPWVNNCVNFTNYKYFILLMGYALLFCLFIIATSLQYVVIYWVDNRNGTSARFHILFLFVLSMMFVMTLTPLFVYHCYLVSVNRSTLESLRALMFRSGPDRSGFSLGKSKNFKQVFGEDVAKWFFPIRTTVGDGVSFPQRTQAKVESGSLEEQSLA